MPLARKRLISLVDTPYYHCVSRCVRRAFLCGKDKLTGRDYEHRRQWVEDRLILLADVFAIDICAFAVMSNHTHFVLHVDQETVKNWSNEEVLVRWHKLHRGTLLSKKYMDKRGPALSETEWLTLSSTITIYRKRLMDISWFMKELNEPIARQANKEDNCTGHFWEGRFKSQALLDEHALVTCMAYVDLNPIRAKMASTLESSSHTSIKLRIEEMRKGTQPKHLLPFVGNPKAHQPAGLIFNLLDYIQLVDLTGRSLDPKKRGVIEASTSPILKRLDMDDDQWHRLSHAFESQFSVAAGQTESLRQFQQHTKRKRLVGIKQSGSFIT